MIRLSEPTILPSAIEKIRTVLDSGNLVYGAVGQEFEKRLTAYIGCKHALVVSSGTAALHIALNAIEVGPGDRVIVPGFTFPATANAVMLTGAQPVLADVDPGTYCISPESVKRLLNQHKDTVKAIIPVHQFGYPADINALKELSGARYIIEDAACALGAKYNGQEVGTLGDIGCFSFHPRKTLTTGEGGLITTQDSELATIAKILRNHGISPGKGAIEFERAGFNYRLSDIHSALGLANLEFLDQALYKRARLAEIYTRYLSDIDEVTLPHSANGHSWQTFMITVGDSLDRDRIINMMLDQGIQTNIGAYSLSLLTAYKSAANDSGTPNSNRLFKKGLALPFCESYTEETVVRVVKALKASITKLRRQL